MHIPSSFWKELLNRSGTTSSVLYLMFWRTMDISDLPCHWSISPALHRDAVITFWTGLFFLEYLFIWLLQVLAVDCGLFSCSMWDLVPPLDWTCVPCTGNTVLATGPPGKSLDWTSSQRLWWKSWHSSLREHGGYDEERQTTALDGPLPNSPHLLSQLGSISHWSHLDCNSSLERLSGLSPRLCITQSHSVETRTSLEPWRPSVLYWGASRREGKSCCLGQRKRDLEKWFLKRAKSCGA